MKVVIVDDDQLVALSLKTILEADARVTVVAIGTDGTDAAALYPCYTLKRVKYWNKHSHD